MATHRTRSAVAMPKRGERRRHCGFGNSLSEFTKYDLRLTSFLDCSTAGETPALPGSTEASLVNRKWEIQNPKCSGLARDFAPLNVLGGCVNGESFFVLNENTADYAGVISTAEIQHRIRDDADLFVGVEESESRLG